MPEANDNATTIPDASLPQHLGDLQPTSCKYVAANEVLVSFATKAGDPVSFTMSTDSMMDLTNRMVAVVQNFTAQVLKDLRATG